VGRLGLRSISCLAETLTHLDQVAGHVGPANVEAEPLDHAASLDDGAAFLPERASLLRAILHDAGREAERAALWLDLAHGLSVATREGGAIRAAPESGCGLLLKREHGQSGGAEGYSAGEANQNTGLAGRRGVLTHQ
jgi:hypothetical protein